MKEKLRKWLGMTTCEHVCKCVSLKQINDEVGKILQQFSESKCVQCSKPILAHYGGFYRNSNGEVFCSSGCIEELKKQV